MQRRISSDRSPLAAARALARRSRWLARAVQARREAADERKYIALREQYAHSMPWRDASSDDLRQRHALERAWNGPSRTYPSASDVRLFIVTGELDTTLTFVPELERNFDTDTFSFVDWLPASRSQIRHAEWRERLQHDILTAFHSAHKRKPFDLAFLYVTHFECTAETLRSMRMTGVPTVIWSGDDKHSFEGRPGIPSGQRPLIGAATLHATSSLECVRWYESEGAAAYYMPPGADPEIFRPLGLEKDIDVSFVGGWYGPRRELISRLRERGIRVDCWGPETERGPLSRDDVVRVFNRSKVNLGFAGTGETTKVTCFKARDFEVPMTGNVYLTQYSAELAEQYAIGQEVLCYLNEIDCVEQIRLILARQERASEIGRAARARSLRSHTWARRMSDLLQWMGIVRPS